MHQLNQLAEKKQCEMNLMGIIINFPRVIKQVEISDWQDKKYESMYKCVKEALQFTDAFSYNEVSWIIDEQEYLDLSSLHLTDSKFLYRMHRNKQSHDKIVIDGKLNILVLESEKWMDYDTLHERIDDLWKWKIVHTPEVDLSFDNIFKNIEQELICSTGFEELDVKIKGWINECWLYVIAGRTWMGKTTLAVNIFKTAIQFTKSVYYSFEMTEKEISVKLASSVFEKIIWEIKSDSNNYRDARNILKQNFKIKTNPRQIDDLISDMQYEAWFWVKLFVIDNIGNMPPKNRTWQEQITEICARLKNFCIDNKVAVLLLSQINREAEKSNDRLPELNQLKHSWALEEYADCVLLCFRAWKYDKDETHNRDDNIDILIAKNRYGQERWRWGCTLKWNWHLSLITE